MMPRSIGQRITPERREDGAIWPVFSAEAHGDIVGEILSVFTKATPAGPWAVCTYVVTLWDAEGDTRAERRFHVWDYAHGARSALRAAKRFALTASTEGGEQ